MQQRMHLKNMCMPVCGAHISTRFLPLSSMSLFNKRLLQSVHANGELRAHSVTQQNLRAGDS